MKTPYLEWKSAVSPDKVFSETVGFSELKTQGEDLYWVEMRPAENGRYAIVKKTAKEMITLTPKEYSVRNRVHEYGGSSFTVRDETIYFVNYSDERIYKQQGDIITALTKEKNDDGSLGKYASLVVSPDGNYLVFVYEKEYEDKQNENYLAMLDLRKEMHEPIILASGKDFYGDPVFHEDKIAWLQWDLPWMPWDETELMIAQFGETLRNVNSVVSEEKVSVCMPRFDNNGKLYFAMDKIAQEDSPDNYWNLYCYDGQISPVTQELAEFGEPHWVFGMSSYAILSDGSILARQVIKGEESLVHIKDNQLIPLQTDLTYLDCLTSDANDTLYFLGGSPTQMPSIIAYDGSIEIIKKNTTLEFEAQNTSIPKQIAYPTTDGATSHGFLYLPKNKNYEKPEDELPPLLVIAHGGPTAATIAPFSFIVQYWTSMGYAVMDVNYRGSTGYGRVYRDALLGNWGVVDADDVANAAVHLIKEGIVDPKRVAIRGGSAGGYIVQCVLTRHPEVFTTGASYFGIGNLITMEETTHKFESLYTDILIDATYPEGIEKFKERSPINYLDRLKAPMIILQGTEDKIVPPECSREMAEILTKKGIPNEYVEYEGEAHGFRSKKNNVDSLQKETSFYHKVFTGKI